MGTDKNALKSHGSVKMKTGFFAKTIHQEGIFQLNSL